MIRAEGVEYDVSTRTTVVYVADKVQSVDCKLLDKVAHCNDEFISTFGRNYRRNNLVEIPTLVVFMSVVKKLFNDVGKLFRKGFAYL